MWRRKRTVVAELVSDCEVLLLSHYPQRLTSGGRTVPVWAWTSLLAHGRGTDRRNEALAVSQGDAGSGKGARARVCAELLRATGPDCSLADL